MLGEADKMTDEDKIKCDRHGQCLIHKRVMHNLAACYMTTYRACQYYNLALNPICPEPEEKRR